MKLIALVARLAAQLVTLSLVACGRSGEAPDVSTPLEMIEECAPYYSLDNRRSLDFDTSDMTVELSEVKKSSTDPPGSTLDTASDIQKSHGSFKINEGKKLVEVTVGGVTATLLVMEADGGQQCSLIAGRLEAADLTASWFSVPAPPDNEDEDGPS